MSAVRIDATALHARLGGGAWTEVLRQVGVGEEFLRGKRYPGPCPLCGGHDRYTYDNRHDRGDYFCRQCGAGDGLTLVQKLFRLSFPEAIERVAVTAGIIDAIPKGSRVEPLPEPSVPARPSRRVLDILRGACKPEDVADVREYLAGRGLWPLPQGCSLCAHASLDYFEGRERVGRFAALVAEVRDINGTRVTAHLTHLVNGHKIADHEPRKILSPLTGRQGCAVRLMPLVGDALGIAEGIETALSASALHDGLATWAALNTSLLAKFEPPAAVRRLVVFADRDVPGLEAGARLMERLQQRVTIELRTPLPPHSDWNDALMGAA
jgi:putative DNA primase/helicase